MGIIVIGRRTFGRIEHADGTADATEFFHGNYLPIIPVAGLRLVGTGAQPAPLRAASVALAYARGWLWLPALAAGVYGFIAPTDGTGLIASAAIAIAAVLTLQAWAASWFIGARSPWSLRRRFTASVVLTLPVLALGAGLFAVFRDHPAMQEHRCAAGDATACYELGRKVELGMDYVHRDTVRAAALYARACQGGVTRACTRR